MLNPICVGLRLLAALMGCAVLAALPVEVHATQFEVTLPGAVKQRDVIRGQLLVIVTKDGSREPRAQITRNGPAVIGMEIPEWQPGRTIVVDNSAVSSPPLEQIAPGEYYVQAVLVRYEKMTRADGHTIWVPAAERSAITQLSGNFYSEPILAKVDPAQRGSIALTLAHQVPAPTPPSDTQWIKHIRIQSALLSKFWGKPMYLGASVLVPRGWSQNQDQRYPILLQMSPGQDASRPYFFNPDPVTGSRSFGPQVNIETGYELYRTWISDDFPRLLVASIIQPTPFFMEGYATDSANNGPVGQAIVEELIPAIEKKFRAVGKPHARVVQGLSTGGWEALSLQLKYPDFFGGVWTFNPDPIDFRHMVMANLYEDGNAFAARHDDWTTVERPFQRTIEGQTLQTMRELSLRELALGSHARSRSQLDAWNAAYGPVGSDGYPREMWDKRTGLIDREVVDYMRSQGYDLTDYLRRNWTTLGPKLAGKINLISADMDEYHLNLAIDRFVAAVHELGGPQYPIRIVYGRGKGHDWHHVNFGDMIREVAAQVRRHEKADDSRQGEQP